MTMPPETHDKTALLGEPDQDDQREEPLPRGCKAPPFLVLAGALLLTALATVMVHTSTRATDRSRFENAMQATEDRIRSKLDAQITLLRGVSAMFASDSNEVNAKTFGAYIASMATDRNHRGVQGIGYSKRFVTESDRAWLEASGSVVSWSPQAYPAATEPHAIVFLEPPDARNKKALGFNMHSETVRREAMDRARDSGNAAMSGLVTLVQENESNPPPGFLMYLPVYQGGDTPNDETLRKEKLHGHVYSAFRANDVFAQVFGTEREPRVRLKIFDGLSTSQSNLLIDSLIEPTQVGKEPMFVAESMLTIAGRPWTLQFMSTRQFEQTSRSPLVYWATFVGALVSLALFAVTRSQVREREIAERMAEERAFAAVQRAHLYGEAQSLRAAAELERTRLHSLFVQAPVSIASFVGADHTYVLSNPRHRKMFNAIDVEGQPVRDALPWLAGQGLFELFDNVFKSGEAQSLEEFGAEGGAPNGATAGVRFFNIVLEPVRDVKGTVSGVMMIASEVTEQVLARRRIEQLVFDLEKAVRSRDEFLSIASHELKTPLTSLQLQVQGLLRLPTSEHGTERSLRRLERADAQVRRLTSLIQELLDATRIAAGRFHIHREPFEVAELVREVSARFEDELSRTSTRLTLDLEPVNGSWDRERLDQVTTNLLSNAIKYGQGKAIEVKLRSQKNGMLLSVRDHGMGISPQDQIRIFDRFERAASVERYGGLGLGLWIVREIVHAHGGGVEVESILGEGSTFTIELPFGNRLERESYS